jgi:hypothetical protein
MNFGNELSVGNTFNIKNKISRMFGHDWDVWFGIWGLWRVIENYSTIILLSTIFQVIARPQEKNKENESILNATFIF